jgi:hypothetical protein
VCAEPNDPARRFCRRCGSNLDSAAAVPAKRPPWWRRIFRRRKRELAAGERPTTMSPAKRTRPTLSRAAFITRWALTGLVALGLIGVVAIPSLRSGAIEIATGGLDQIRRIVAPRLAPETPAAVTSTDELLDHPVARLFDRRRPTAWQAGGPNPSATATFEHPVDLGAVIIHPGIEDGFLDFRRPSRVAFAFEDGSSAEFDLEDVPDPQTFDLNAPAVDTVEIRVLETKGPAGAPLAFAEIEFFTRN